MPHRFETQDLGGNYLINFGALFAIHGFPVEFGKLFLIIGRNRVKFDEIQKCDEILTKNRVCSSRAQIRCQLLNTTLQYNKRRSQGLFDSITIDFSMSLPMVIDCENKPIIEIEMTDFFVLTKNSFLRKNVHSKYPQIVQNHKKTHMIRHQARHLQKTHEILTMLGTTKKPMRFAHKNYLTLC